MKLPTAAAPPWTVSKGTGIDPVSWRPESWIPVWHGEVWPRIRPKAVRAQAVTIRWAIRIVPRPFGIAVYTGPAVHASTDVDAAIVVPGTATPNEHQQ